MMDDRQRRNVRSGSVRLGLAGFSGLLLVSCGGSDGSSTGIVGTAGTSGTASAASASSVLAAPPIPTGLFVNPTGDASITSAYVGWEKSTGANGYRVRYKVNSGSWTVMTVQGGDTLGVQLPTNLAQGGTLTVNVASVGNGQISASSDPVTATLSADPTPTELANYTNAVSYSEGMHGDAVIIMKNGRILPPYYKSGYDPDFIHGLASGTKSFNCALEAFAEKDGLMSLDDKASSVITEWQGTDKSQITVRNLLGLNSTLNGNSAYVPSTPQLMHSYYLAVNETLATGGGAHVPGGDEFIYDPLSFQNFAMLFEVAAGASYQGQGQLGGESDATDPVKYLQTKLFDQIEISTSDYDWIRDADGHPQLAGGAKFKASAWLNFGQFMLQRGTWKTDRLLPAAKLDYCTMGTGAPEGGQGGYINTAFQGYGLSWWLNRDYGTTYSDPPDHVPAAALPLSGTQIAPAVPADMYMAAGAGYERLYIIPSRGLVVIRLATGGAGDSYSDNTFLGKLIGTLP